jgi:hypothetical protein
MKKRVSVDSDLADEARRLGSHPTTAAAVEEALKEYVHLRRAQLRIVDLFGTIDFDPEYDYKSARSGRLPVSFEPYDIE